MTSRHPAARGIKHNMPFHRRIAKPIRVVRIPMQCVERNPCRPIKRRVLGRRVPAVTVSCRLSGKGHLSERKFDTQFVAQVYDARLRG